MTDTDNHQSATTTQKWATPQEAFEKSPTTISDYLRDAGKYDSIEKHQQVLCECIAIKPAGFILKEACDKSYRYHEKGTKELTDYLDVFYKIEYTTEVLDTKTGKKEQETKTCTYKPLMTLKDGQFRTEHMAFYNKTELMSNKTGVLSRYIPPQGGADDTLAKKFISFFESRVKNPEALHDELTAHAYRFRHPTTRCGKVYWHHSTNAGNSGKTFLTSVIAGMYPDLSMVCSDKSVQSDFNSFLFDYLNLNFEELENENYRNKFFETFIKRTSGRTGQKRRMYHEYETGQYMCITSVNTNSSDCYGVVRADRPTLERCVFIEFKPYDEAEVDWDAVKDQLGANDRRHDYDTTFERLCAALQHYLQYEYVNPYLTSMENWNPQRDYSDAKWKLVREMCKNSERLPTKFIRRLTMKDDDEYEYDSYSILRKMRCRGGDVVIFVSARDIERSWNQFVSDLSVSERGRYTSQSVVDELLRLGWRRKKTMTCNGYCIPLSEYEEWRSENGQLDDIDDDELVPFEEDPNPAP